MNRNMCIPVKVTTPCPPTSTDLTPQLVKMFYEANGDTNGFTDVEKYELDMLIKHGGHTNSAEELGGIAWKGGIDYKVGAVVISNNVPYKCITAHTSVSWASNINNWEFIISDPGKF